MGPVVVVSGWLELLGLRILEPGLSLRGAWGPDLLLGTLRTTGGALLLGLVAVAGGLLFRRSRAWTRAHLLRLGAAGAAAFLLAIAGLVAWAP